MYIHPPNATHSGSLMQSDHVRQLLLTGHPVDGKDRSVEVRRLLQTGIRSPTQQAHADAWQRHIATGTLRDYLLGGARGANASEKPRRRKRSTAKDGWKAARARLAEHRRWLEMSRWRDRPEASTIVHEAGHATVAYILCGPRVLGSEGAWAIGEPDEYGELGGVFINSDRIKDPLDKLAINFAGSVAEEEVLGLDLDVRGTDRSRSIELVRGLEGWTDSPEQTGTWRRGLNRARRVIRTNRTVLNELTGRLSLDGILPGEHIIRILRGKVKRA